MKIDFDGIRKNLANVYKRLIVDYRELIEKYENNNIFFELKSDLDDIRQLIGALLYCYDEEHIKKENDFHALGEIANKLPYADIEDEVYSD